MIEFYKEWYRPQALSFDLDDTLYANDEVIAAAEQYMLDHISANYLGGALYTKSMYDEGRLRVLEIVPELVHDVSLLRFFIYQRLLLLHGSSLNKATADAMALMQEFVRVRSQVLVPTVSCEVVRELAFYYPIVALSNGNIDLRYTALKGVFLHEVRPNINLRSKPGKEIFSVVARTLSLPCSAICHIGDNEITDVQGAVQAGMSCIWQAGYKGAAINLTVLPHVKITEIEELLPLLVR